MQKKLIIVLVVSIFLVCSAIGGFSFYLRSPIIQEITKENGANFLYSCEITGGNIEVDECGSACWSGYPDTKGERIKDETTPTDFGKMCIMSCSQNTTCECPKGQYFGSVEEGCINLTQRKEPSNEDKEAFDKKREDEFKEILDKAMKSRTKEQDENDPEKKKLRMEGLQGTTVDNITFEYSTRDIGRFYGTSCSMSGCVCENNRCMIKLDTSKINKIYTNNLPKNSMDITPIREIISSKIPIEDPISVIQETLDGPYKNECVIKNTLLFYGYVSKDYDIFEIKNNPLNPRYDHTLWNCSSLIIGQGISDKKPLQYFMYSKKSKRLLLINLSSDWYPINPYTIQF